MLHLVNSKEYKKYISQPKPAKHLFSAPEKHDITPNNLSELYYWRGRNSHNFHTPKHPGIQHPTNNQNQIDFLLNCRREKVKILWQQREEKKEFVM